MNCKKKLGSLTAIHSKAVCRSTWADSAAQCKVQKARAESKLQKVTAENYQNEPKSDPLQELVTDPCYALWQLRSRQKLMCGLRIQAKALGVKFIGSWRNKSPNCSAVGVCTRVHQVEQASFKEANDNYGVRAKSLTL